MKIAKMFIVLIALLLLAGCGGGSADLSSLFGGSSSGSGFSSGSSGSGSSGSGSSSGSSGGSSGSGSSGGSGGGVTLAHTPEPTTLALFGIGLAGLALARRRKGKK